VGALAELDDEAIDRWQQVASTNTTQSPFFDPHVIRALCGSQPGARVAMMHDGESTSILAFTEIGRHGRAIASGRWGTLADHQGIIGPHEAESWFPRGSTAGIGVRSLLLDHVCDGGGLAPWETSRSVSPRIDLRDGYAGYLDRRRVAGSGLAAWLRRKRSLLEREVGEVRFAPVPTGVERQDAFDQLRSWKSAQYRRTGAPDLFAEPWVRDGLDRLAALPSYAGSSAPLAVLSAGGTPIAAHLGVANGELVHWWLPAYDPSMSRYSPGAVLLSELCQWAAATGRHFVDLGRGDESYKQRFSDSSFPLTSVLIRPDGWHGRVRAVRRMIAK
jgi:CelD/BcsL family acetyltransferase involved in cellulose biosynthesis